MAQTVCTSEMQPYTYVVKCNDINTLRLSTYKNEIICCSNHKSNWQCVIIVIFEIRSRVVCFDSFRFQSCYPTIDKVVRLYVPILHVVFDFKTVGNLYTNKGYWSIRIAGGKFELQIIFVHIIFTLKVLVFYLVRTAHVNLVRFFLSGG
jgi:hypothetical protein